jgi:hypothetical protein
MSEQDGVLHTIGSITGRKVQPTAEEKANDIAEAYWWATAGYRLQALPGHEWHERPERIHVLYQERAERFKEFLKTRGYFVSSMTVRCGEFLYVPEDWEDCDDALAAEDDAQDGGADE